ncbi:MAG TPA: tripartite tricarboxylate transporter TctB family protein [Caldimonas sp.]|jgi:hypothetical protein|nr:tripartite tricarboxylate transporter TctB family protein [Caldimonas sp.]HEX2542413.1 tripartite tricarboxylate transporter TctB family protein [Caldimonas sp.]
MARRGEVGTAIVWLVVGAAVTVASWRMDRLRHLDVNPWSVPGLTPGAIGVLMMLFAGVLAWRALRGAADGPADAAAAPAVPGGTRSVLLAGVLCLLFAGLALGRGAPFVVEGAVFVFAFTSIFSWRSWRDEGRVARGLAQTAAIAVAAALLISWLFESVFLVRLP